MYFGISKDIFVKYVRKIFQWMAVWQSTSSITVDEVTCVGCKIDDYRQNHHRHVVLFHLNEGTFALDIKPTEDGRFILGNCNSYIGGSDNDDNMIRFAIIIPEDLLPDFNPSEWYLRLLKEKKIMLSEIDNGSVVFWFLEDLSDWIEKHDWAIKTLEDGIANTSVFHDFRDALHVLTDLEIGMQSEDLCLEANKAFEHLNQNDPWEIYP